MNCFILNLPNFTLHNFEVSLFWLFDIKTFLNLFIYTVLWNVVDIFVVFWIVLCLKIFWFNKHRQICSICFITPLKMIYIYISLIKILCPSLMIFCHLFIVKLCCIIFKLKSFYTFLIFVWLTCYIFGIFKISIFGKTFVFSFEIFLHGFNYSIWSTFSIWGWISWFAGFIVTSHNKGAWGIKSYVRQAIDKWLFLESLVICHKIYLTSQHV